MASPRSPSASAVHNLTDPRSSSVTLTNDMKPAPLNAPTLSIVGVDPEHGFAGGESQVLALTLALLRAGHRADLICHPAGALWQRAQAGGVLCRPLQVRNSVDVMAGFKLRKMLARGDYDVVHFHTARAHALAPFARGRARALVVTRRMDYPPSRISARFLYNRAVDGVAAISPAVAGTLIAAGVAADRVTIIPSGVDCERFRPPTPAERERARAQLGLAPEAIAIGTIGMLEPRKGQRYLIEAMVRMRDNAAVARRTSMAAGFNCIARKVVCLIAGGGTLAEELAEQIRARRLGSTRLLGMIEDPRELLWALDIFILPSLHEGLGVAALEAMACGLPVVASAVGGLVDAVVEGVTGIHEPPGDDRGLADAIARLASDPELLAAMGAAGRARACQNYAIASMARGTLELYRACLNNRGISRR
jgi:glycosyltransferase involved in cell wall biosynthesis